MASLHKTPHLHKEDVEPVVHHEVEADHLEELAGGAEPAGRTEHGRLLHQVHGPDRLLDLTPDPLRSLAWETK